MSQLESMSRLERRYRRLLRLLPAFYREQWEDDMVATFLATMEPDDPDDAPIVGEYSSPSFAEARSVLALSVRLRLGGVGAPRKYVIAGSAVRRIALLGLLFQSAMAILSIVAWGSSLAVLPDPVPAFSTVLSWLWLPAFLTLLFGHKRAAAALAVPAAASPLISLVLDVINGIPPFGFAVYELLFAGLIVTALLGFHRESPKIRPRPWLIALPVVTVLGATVELLHYLIRVADPASYASVAIFLAGLAFLLTPRLPWRQEPVEWAAALAVLGAVALAGQVIALIMWSSTGNGPALLTSAIVHGVAVLAITKALTIFAHRAGRARRQAPEMPG